MRILALVLIVVGVLALVYEGFTYTKRRDTVQVGPVGITAEQKQTVPVPPIVGVVAIVAGLGLLFVSRKKA
ncbi:MAG TPA: LPXTG cell wall anchor domain-containing protein [Gemmatimonadaceae bacterium]|jgi:LPXTG-motif cell wall-anchored protein|nr:LPXTG cell wall anchor domain-containing protein [Gemmatimonadaceae bacterium]